MTPSILLTGGTGTLGRHVVPRLRAAGCDLRVLSRQPHDSGPGLEYVMGDLQADDGTAAAVDGAEVVLHLAGAQKGDDEATRNLMRAAAAAGSVRHVVFISVIGADRVPVRWLRMKLVSEQAVVDSGLPWTILRAAQFHDLVLKVVQTMGKLPVVPSPGGLRFEPVDAREVAGRLTELALGPPAGLVPELAGPEVRPLGDFARSYLKARGKRRPLVPLRMPGKAGRAYRAGANLAGDGADRGTRTFADFLAERLPSEAPSAAPRRAG